MLLILSKEAKKETQSHLFLRTPAMCQMCQALEMQLSTCHKIFSFKKFLFYRANRHPGSTGSCGKNWASEALWGRSNLCHILFTLWHRNLIFINIFSGNLQLQNKVWLTLNSIRNQLTVKTMFSDILQKNTRDYFHQQVSIYFF